MPYELVAEYWTVSDLYPIKQLIQHQEFENMLDKYDNLYSLDLFGETIEGHRNIKPYELNPIEGEIILNRAFYFLCWVIKRIKRECGGVFLYHE